MDFFICFSALLGSADTMDLRLGWGAEQPVCVNMKRHNECSVKWLTTCDNEQMQNTWHACLEHPPTMNKLKKGKTSQMKCACVVNTMYMCVYLYLLMDVYLSFAGTSITIGNNPFGSISVFGFIYSIKWFWLRYFSDFSSKIVVLSYLLQHTSCLSVLYYVLMMFTFIVNIT